MAEPAAVVGLDNALGFGPEYIWFLSCKYGHLSPLGPLVQLSNAKYMQGSRAFSSGVKGGLLPEPGFLPLPLPLEVLGAAFTEEDAASDACF